MKNSFLLLVASVLISTLPSFGQSLLSYTNAEGKTAPVKTLYEWQIKREQILDSMQALFGKLPGDPMRPPFNSALPDLPPYNVQIKDSLKTNLYVRYNIRFTVAPEEDVTAYLYVPVEKNKNSKFPAMLALHETDMLGKKSVDGQGHNINLAYGKELAQRGYVVLAPDYPGFGDQKEYDFKTDRYESGIMKAIFNNIRCVDFLQSRTDTDPERIGVIGHSLGGHSAMWLAAFEPRLKVVVSSCGWTPNRYYNNYNEAMRKKMGGRLWGYAQERYTMLALTKYHLRAEDMPFDYEEVIAAIAPRAFFSNSPVHDANFNVEGVRVGIARASEVYHFLDADDQLQVRYPVSGHDFPPEVRFESYRYIDKMLKENKE
ncbi:MAG: alpha/beta fold hydrolase [Chitinophagaceae bacterium]|nr:alpha/beta fold hydrolase [Chitinophagaceae bacterium]